MTVDWKKLKKAMNNYISPSLFAAAVKNDDSTWLLYLIKDAIKQQQEREADNAK